MKKTRYRVIAAVLAAVMVICSIAVSCAATDYSDAISSVMSTFRRQDSSASNINHQILNGRYRTVQMLEIIAYELDSKGVYSDAISSVMSTFRRQDSSASNINHQILNGCYRTVQMLEIVAYECVPDSAGGKAQR